MGVNRFQNRLGEARKLGVELEMHARGKKREAFQQSLDKWVRADVLCVAIQRKPSGDFWEIAGELPSGFPKVLEFDVVEIQEAAIHD